MIHLVAFVLTVAALVRWTKSWTRGILLTVLILGTIGILLG